MFSSHKDQASFGDLDTNFSSSHLLFLDSPSSWISHERVGLIECGHRLGVAF